MDFRFLICRRKQQSIAHTGYGLALLMIFVASTLLIGTSMSLILAPSISGYFGTSSVENSSAKQIALMGLAAAQNDMLTQMAAGTTITTSYRYPASGSNSITAPTYPGSGSSTTVGSYYVTISKARGYTYLLVSNATVNNTTSTASRLIQMSASAPLSASYFAAYSLRKIVSSYTGFVASVRCTSGGTVNIGFDGNGDFDLSSLKTCLGDTTLPVDLTSGAKLAYGLRKLSSGYSSYAIQVRRSSDNTTQNIGFDSLGRLDTQALKTFVGTSSGYVTTWYDQSGSGKDATQATAGAQPRIVNAGVIDSVNNTPTIIFDGSNDYLGNTSLGGTVITGSNVSAFMVAEQNRTDTSGKYDRYLTLHKSNASSKEDWQIAGGYELFAVDESATGLITQTITKAAAGTPVVTGVPFQATAYHDSSNNLKLYKNGTLIDSNSSTSTTFSPDQLYLGVGGEGTGIGPDFLSGGVSEVIIFNPATAITTPTQNIIEKNQGHYYNLTGLRDGYVTKWYDQSGHGYHLTQTTAANQPTIDQTGSRPAILFDKTLTTYLDNGTLSTTLSPGAITGFGVGQILIRTTSDNDHQIGEMLAIYKTGEVSDRAANSESVFSQSNKSMSNSKDSDFLHVTDPSLLFNADLQATFICDGANRTIRQYQTAGGLLTATTTNKASQGITINAIRIGADSAPNNNAYWDGRINEVILVNKALTSSQYQSIESDEKTYYGL